MASAETLPPELQDALRDGLLKRLPVTFLPFVNQQLREWNNMFPYERQSISRFLVYVGGLSEEQRSSLFRDVVSFEGKMEVRRWAQFSTGEQTIENASLLARSPYYQAWRQAVQAVFDKVEQHASPLGAASRNSRRLVLVVIPQPLPLDRATVWRRWQGIGRPVKLDLASVGKNQKPSQFLLRGAAGADGKLSGGLLDARLRGADASSADTWICDAGSNLVDGLLHQGPADAGLAPAVLLSYARLDPFRERFAHEMNTMRKDLADADAVYDHLRKVEITAWCPAEVASDPAPREFVRSLYLSGNGALIYGNSFVEWAASEAFRRARPSFLVAHFGARSKPKPFTSVVLFENPDRLNPLPSVDDLAGSAVDAEMLALYVWLAAIRYAEYQHSTVCVCLAESLSEAYLVAPPEFGLTRDPGPVAIDRLAAALRAWIA